MAYEIAEQARIRSTPTEIFYKEGKEVSRANGPLVMDGLMKIITEVEYM